MARDSLPGARYVSSVRNLPLSSVKVKTAVALLEEIEEPLDMPADEVAKVFFKKNGPFSPEERLESSKLAFTALNYWLALGWWLARLRSEIPELTRRFGHSPRLRVLVYLVLKEKWDVNKVKQHFSKPTQMELDIASKLQGKDLVSTSMPPWLQV